MDYFKDTILDYPFLESMFRWAHVVAGVLWIGLLYFFNWVNSAFVPTMDADTKKKVVPELLPRTLFWFRFGALWTWATGIVLLLLVFWRDDVMMVGAEGEWNTWTYFFIGGIFASVILYDLLYKTVLKNPQVGFFAGWILASGVYVLLVHCGKFEFRAAAIHTAAMFGTFMAFNVWMRIWPAQKKIITAIKNGEKPDPALAAMAGSRSKHNTYMSIPLLFLMLNQHMNWAAADAGDINKKLVWVPAMILIGWLVTFCLYKKAATVKGM